MQKPVNIYTAETEGDSLFHTQRQSEDNKHGTLFINTVQQEAGIFFQGFKPGVPLITDKATKWMKNILE